MSAVDDEEFLLLRRRAYGPDADLLDDPDALDRLRDLENARSPREIRTQPETPSNTVIEPDRPSSVVSEEPPPASGTRFRAQFAKAYRMARNARRSSALICLGAVVVVVSLIAVLTIVRRVQVDPLQAGATQVARLSVDTGYKSPGFFSSEGRDDIRGFELFNGLRAVVGTAEGGADECLSIFAESDMLAANSNGFTGLALGGCAAGKFPAIVQFRSNVQGSPDELGSAFPSPTALQFVYDRADDEVVVFAEAD